MVNNNFKGTPLFYEQENKTELITLRLTPKQKARIIELAEIEGLSISRFIIRLVSAEHERQAGAKAVDDR
jgi:uncharacterized protein (DUF1778 family)